MKRVKRFCAAVAIRAIGPNILIANLLIVALCLCSCGPSGKQQAEEKEKQPGGQNAAGQGAGSYADLAMAVFRIDTYDNNRILETGMGFFIAPEIAVTRLSFFQSANKASIKPFTQEKTYEVTGYVAVDRINDLILLKIPGVAGKPVVMTDSILSANQKTFYISRPTTNVVPIHPGTVLSYSNALGTKLYRISQQLRSKSAGSPVFDHNNKCIGLAFMEVADYETQTFVTPSPFINQMLQKADLVRALSQLQNTSGTGPAQDNSQVHGMLLETDLGNIRIKLYQETAQYRDNFIKLSREGYYDGLLIHRVIRGFGIQSGAADTRYAEPTDVVGWKGPGYTLPAHIVPGLYHRRGMIGSPRKPERENQRKRSDGSQFYIVTGRIYTDAELDDLEKETGHRFTPEQRNTYKTLGGAPHLDGTYTLFGEVTQGMDVADRISQVDVGEEYRPLKDIRIKKITILE